MIRKNCECCGKFHWVYPYLIKKGQGRYCSMKCFYNSNKKGVYKNCKNCGKKYYVRRSFEKRGINKNCCSRDCSLQYGDLGVKKIYPKTYKLRRKLLSSGRVTESVNSLRVKTGRVVTCKNCSKEIYRRNCRVQDDKNYYCSSDCLGEDRKIYPNTYYLRNKIRTQQKIDNLHDSYIKSTISLPANDIPKELIELKRLNIKRKRKLKEITHGNPQ